MKIKLIENKSLLNEIKMEQVLPRFESKAFLDAIEKNNEMLKKAGNINSNSFRYDELDQQKARNFCIDCIPSDIEKKYHAEALNWVITKFIQGKLIDSNNQHSIVSDTRRALEIFYQIKQLKLDRFLEKSDIYKIDSIYNFVFIVHKASKLFKQYNEEKAYNKDWQKGAKVIHDDDLWTVYIPENKAAACYLGKGTEWCTAAPGLQYYEQYHKPDDPLIIFISKKDPTQKFQLHFGTQQFMDKDDRYIYNDTLLLYFFHIIKENSNVPESVQIEASIKERADKGSMNWQKLNNLERTENGYYTKMKETDGELQCYYNHLFELDRKEEEGPASIKIYNDGKIFEKYIKNGKIHAINRPATSYKNTNSEEPVMWFYYGQYHNFNGPASYSLNSSSNSRLSKNIEYFWFGKKELPEHYAMLRNAYKKSGNEDAKYIKDDVVINESKIKIRLLR